MNTEQKTSHLTFDEAYKLMPTHRLARPDFAAGEWVSRSAGVQDVSADSIWIPMNREAAVANDGVIDVEPYFTCHTAAGTIRMGWQPTAEDREATDWFVQELSEPMLHNHANKLLGSLRFGNIRKVTVQRIDPVYSIAVASGHLRINYPVANVNPTARTLESVDDKLTGRSISQALRMLFDLNSIVNRVVMSGGGLFDAIHVDRSHSGKMDDPTGYIDSLGKTLTLHIPQIAEYHAVVAARNVALAANASQPQVKTLLLNVVGVACVTVTADGSGFSWSASEASLTINLPRAEPYAPTSAGDDPFTTWAVGNASAFEGALNALVTGKKCSKVTLTVAPDITITVSVAVMSDPVLTAAYLPHDVLAITIPAVLTSEVVNLNAGYHGTAVGEIMGGEAVSNQLVSNISKIILTNTDDVASVTYDNPVGTMRINMPYLRCVTPADGEPEVYKFKDKARRVNEIVAALDRFIDGRLLYMAIHFPKPMAVDLQTSSGVLFNVTDVDGVSMRFDLPPHLT